MGRGYFCKHPITSPQESDGASLSEVASVSLMAEKNHLYESIRQELPILQCRVYPPSGYLFQINIGFKKEAMF